MDHTPTNSYWTVYFKNGGTVRVKGGREVMNVANPANETTVLKDIHGKHVCVNNAEVTYVRQDRV